MSPEAPESLAEASRGSKAIPDALPGTQNRSPEAHIGVEIRWLGTNDIEHGSHTARFQDIGAILPPSSEPCFSSPPSRGRQHVIKEFLEAVGGRPPLSGSAGTRRCPQGASAIAFCSL